MSPAGSAHFGPRRRRGGETATVSARTAAHAGQGRPRGEARLPGPGTRVLLLTLLLTPRPATAPGQIAIRADGFASRARPLACSPAGAPLSLLSRGGFALGLTGYVRSLTGIHDLGYDLPATARRRGFNGEVVRLKWSARWGGRAVLEAHNRLQARITSADLGLGQEVAGFGVSVVPRRSVDLADTLVAEPRLTVWHDVDRLALTLYTGAADITVGRQAITWGIASLFPVADLWAQFSPFELDTEEKPGVDAIRVLVYPRARVELDAVVADRGARHDLSAGLRATVGLAAADLTLALGKFWNEVIALGGVTFVLKETKLRAEGALPWNLDDDDLNRPRATLGLDWIRGRLVATAEYHYSGIGAAGASGYLRALADARLRRGESYYLGRHYLGGLVAWSPDPEERLSLTLSALVNLADPSAALTPVLSYDLGQSTSVSVGALQSFGSTPLVAAPPALRSEFGTYGDLWFTRVSVYF